MALFDTPELHTYDLRFSFDPRVTALHLGRQKYSTASRAIGELVANALDAGATEIEVEIAYNELGGEESLRIRDNGIGIDPDTLRSRFTVVGIPPGDGRGVHPRLGRFGVGRLAVHRIGELSQWSTVARSRTDNVVESRFSLSVREPGRIRVSERYLDHAIPTGTSIEIFNLADAGSGGLNPVRIMNDLLGQYCSYLLGQQEVSIIVQGVRLDVQQLIAERRTERIPASDTLPEPAQINHLLLHANVDRSRFPEQLLFAAKGRTVAVYQPEQVPAPNYLGIVECAYLESIVLSNREAIIELDGGFVSLREAALERVASFREKIRSERITRFISWARERDYYPYQSINGDSLAHAEKILYDVILEKVNEHANIESMSNTQRSVIFRLLHRGLGHHDLPGLFSEVAGLSANDREIFRRMLERSSLDSTLRLGHEARARLSFIDELEELHSGRAARHIAERARLDRVLEPHCWIFGDRFNLAAANEGLRARTLALREASGMTPVHSNGLVRNRREISDLLLTASRGSGEISDHEDLLVELVAPTTRIGRDELERIRRYASLVERESESCAEIVVVASRINADIGRQRTVGGIVHEGQRVTVRLKEWEEVIAGARGELNALYGRLQSRSREQHSAEVLLERFPEIIDIPG
jgi:hypothetical protein